MKEAPEIPEDVMLAADAVIEQHRASSGAGLQNSAAMRTFVARAILAERKRCQDEQISPMMQEAWASLRMIREAIEIHGPVGALRSEEHSGSPLKEAEVLSQAIVAMAEAKVPGGWKLVPIEPTQEMQAAADASMRGVFYWSYEVCDESDHGAIIYRAMLNAAPEPASAPLPVQQGDGG